MPRRALNRSSEIACSAVLGALIATSGTALAEQVSLTVTVPGETSVCRLAVLGHDKLGLGAHTTIHGDGAARSAVVAGGLLGATVGTDASIGRPLHAEEFDLLSRGSITLNPHAIVTGSATAGGDIDQHPLSQILGAAQSGVAFAPETTLTIELDISPPLPGASLQPHQVADLAPGSYAELRLQPSSRVRLEEGRYYFDRLIVAPNATVQVTAQSGLTTVFVTGELDFKGAVELTQGPETFLLGYLGSAPVEIAGRVQGTVLAPGSLLRVDAPADPGHAGTFFGKQVDVSPNSTLAYVPFLGWADLLGAGAPPPTLDQARGLPPSCAAPHLCCATTAPLSAFGDDDDHHGVTQAGECVFTAGGDDEVSGVQPQSTVAGGAGADTVRVGQGATVYGGEGDDTIETLGNGIVFGNAGDDVIRVPCGSAIVFPGPGKDTVETGPGDDTVVVNDACELVAGEKLLAGAGHDLLVSPLPLQDLEALGVEVDGFEEVQIERRPCQSECRNPPTCSGVGQCFEDAVSQQLQCDCPAATLGANCQQPNPPAFTPSAPPSLAAVPPGQEAPAALAFMDWFGPSRVGESQAARDALDAGYPNRALRKAFVSLAGALVTRPRTEAALAAIEVAGFLRCRDCEALLKNVINTPVPSTGALVEGEHGGPAGGSDALHVLSLHAAAASALAYQRTPASRDFLLQTVSNHPRVETRLAAVHALSATYGPAIRPDLLARLPAELQLEAYRFPNDAADFGARLLEFIAVAPGN